MSNSRSVKKSERRAGLVGMTSSQAPRIGLASLCMGVAAMATAAYAYLVGPVLRSIFIGQNGLEEMPVPADAGFLLGQADRLSRWDTWAIGLLIVGVAALKGIAFFSQRFLVISAGQRILFALRARLYRGMLTLNPLSKEARNTGELVSRYTVDVEQVEGAVTSGVLALIRDGLQVLALTGLALALDPVLGLVGLIAFPPIAIMIAEIGKEMKKRKGEVLDAFSQVGSSVEETAGGLDVIGAFGAQRLLQRRFERKSRRLMTKIGRALVLKALSSPLNEILGAGALAATLWYAHYRISNGQLSPEAFISFFTALFLLYQPVKGLGQANHAIQSGLAALDRLGFLLVQGGPCDPSDDDNAQFTAGTSSLHPAVEIVGLAAGYEKGADVLRGVNLRIDPGDRMALVGASGSGKSTLINVLCGHLPPGGGQLLVNGSGVEICPSTARSLFAPVPQEPYLFDDSIRMNVLCGRHDATDKEIKDACQAAGVLEFADLDKSVGRAGADLSLGQRQRVCLARALLSKAPVMLFDEVTASLDGETEGALVDRLDGYLGNRAVLLVTHRLSTARWASRVALLQDGCTNKQGSADDLLDADPSVVRLFGRATSEEERVG